MNTDSEVINELMKDNIKYWIDYLNGDVIDDLKSYGVEEAIIDLQWLIRDIEDKIIKIKSSLL